MSTDTGGRPLNETPCVTSCGHPCSADGDCPSMRAARARDRFTTSLEPVVLFGPPALGLTAIWSFASLAHAAAVGAAMLAGSWILSEIAVANAEAPEDVVEAPVFVGWGTILSIGAALMEPSAPWIVAASLGAACLSALWPQRFFNWSAERVMAVDALRARCARPCLGCAQQGPPFGCSVPDR